MEPQVSAAGAARNLSDRVIMAMTTDIVAKRSAAQLASAESDTRRAIISQQRAVIRSAFLRCVTQAYETTDGGVLLGCHADGRLRTRVPWSGRSYPLYGLTSSTAGILRALIVNWPAGFWLPVVKASAAPPPAPVFLDGGRGAWFLNLAAYPTNAAVITATAAWPTEDVVAHFEAELSKQAGIERDKRRQRQRKGWVSAA